MGPIDTLASLIVEQANPIRPSDWEQTTFSVRGVPPIFMEVALERIREIAQIEERIEAEYVALLQRVDQAHTYAAVARSTTPLWY